MTPAAPHTFVVTKDPGSFEGFTKEPVIGYVYDHGKDKPPVVVTLDGERRLIDCGVLFPCGMVVDPLSSTRFEDTEEWLEHTPAKRAKDGASNKRSVGPDDGEDEDDEGSVYDIMWSKKELKNNSFWHYEDGTYEFVFTVPGGEFVPEASEKVGKIKRDEMMVMKKGMDALDLEDVKNPNVLPDADPDEDEDEDEDDDGTLI